MKSTKIVLLLFVGFVIGVATSEILSRYSESVLSEQLPEIQLMLAYEHFHNGADTDALAHVTYASFLRPDWYAPQLLLADIYTKWERPKEALAALETAEALIAALPSRSEIVEHDSGMVKKKKEALLAESN